MPTPGFDPKDVLHYYYAEFDPPDLMQRYSEVSQVPEPGVVRNFLGVRVPPVVYPSILDAMAGTIEPIPNPGNWHADIAEWASALRAVDCAGDVFRVVELGCGWGCWMVNSGFAARKTGRRVELIGVEGDPNHLKNAVKTLEMNGFTSENYKLFHGVAAAQAGHAIFPNVQAGTAGWGAEAIFSPDADTLARAATDPDVQVLDCYTLEQLGMGNVIDLLHIDIQGAEVDYVAGNLDNMNTYVRRVLIGTHSRIIEGQLHDIFLKAGWRMEAERPAIAPIQNGVPITSIDGVHMWINPALAT